MVSTACQIKHVNMIQCKHVPTITTIRSEKMVGDAYPTRLIHRNLHRLSRPFCLHPNPVDKAHFSQTGETSNTANP